MQNAEKQAEFLTVDELAAILKFNVDTVRKWTRTGKIPSVKITAKAVRYRLNDVMEAISSRNNSPQGGSA